MKRIISLLLCAIMVFSSVAFALPVIETVEEAQITADVNPLPAELASTGVKPGLNVFTGTTEAYDFEGDTSNVVFHTPLSAVASVYEDDNGKTVNAVVVREGKDGSSENHAASVDGNGYYFYIDCDFPVIDKERPVKVSYDYILGIGGNQVRTLINYPTKYTGGQREKASFNISYFSGSGMTEETWRSVTHTQAPGTKCKTGSTYYQGGEDMEFVSFVNYSGAAQASYFDNLLCVPYYKVSYDLNGGNGVAESEYFLQDAGTTYTFKNTGADVYKNGYAFKGWAASADATADEVVSSVTVESGKDIVLYAVWEEDATVPNKYLVELYDGETLRSAAVVTEGNYIMLPEYEFTDTEFLLGWETADGNTLAGYRFYPDSDIKLYASWGSNEVKPGINIFENGDFETAGVIDVRPSNGKVEIVDENGNKVLKYTRGSGYASIQHFMGWEAGRMYKIEYKVKTPIAADLCGNIIYTDASAARDHLYNAKTQANTWYTHTNNYTFPDDTDEFTYAATEKDAFSQYVNPMSDIENVVYYDDLVLIPYYKVNYDANGGTGAPEADYFLEGTYTVDTETKPVREGYNFLGWTLKNGSVNLASTVTPTVGEDITLYAAWENISAVNSVTYEFDSDKAGIANGVITVTQNDETAAYTSAEILLADNDGVLENYTPYGTITFAEGSGSYTVSGNRAFPAEATRLAVKFIGEGLEDLYYWYTIPEEKRLVVDEKPLYTFWALSDSHLGGTNYSTDYWKEMTVNRNNAFEDVFASDADFIFINGDVINYGTTPYVKVLDSYLADRLNNSLYNTNNIPVFLTNGNHEYYNTSNASKGFDYTSIEATYNGQLDYLEQTFGDEIKITRDIDDELWYAADIKGAKFIFLSSPQVSEDRLTGGSFAFSEEQLKFLDEQLYEGEKSGKTSYLVTHAPLQNTIPAGYKENADGSLSVVYEGGITNTAKVNAILAKHPNTIVFSGHSHSDLSVDYEHFTVVNDMTTSASHINDGCLVWISAWDGIGTDGAGHTTDFSTGVYLQVYEDKIVARSRKFLDESLYFGHGVYVIELPEGEADNHTVSMTGTAADGENFTALVDGEVPADDAGYTYEWTVGGKVVSTEKTYTVDIEGDYADEYVVLRVTFEDGSYASDISETAFAGVTVSYDANGGTGTVPKSHLHVPGYMLQPDIGTEAPKYEGKYFIGWSKDSAATAPSAEVLVEEDTTLYAVYSDKPEFYFDANLSGFKSANYTSKIENGILNTVSPGGDYYYNWSNSTIDAGTYKYMRIKSQYVSGSGDGMFFAADNSVDDALDIGITSDSRIGIGSGKAVASTSDGFTVREYDMSTNKYWDKNATITALRFDVLAHAANSEVNIDYVVFSDKKGVYGVDITVEEGETAAVIADESVAAIVGDAVWSGNTVSVKIAPADGYEFTFEDELEASAVINNCPLTEATINDDGTATLTVDFDTVVVTDAVMRIGKSSSYDTYYANFGKALGECVIVAGAYNENGRLLGTDIIMRADDQDGVITVKVADSLESDYVKAFAFEDATSLKVIAEAAVAKGNLVVNGDAEGTETTAFYSENGTVSIVEDAEKGKVWQIVPKSGTLYTYFSYYFDYIPGATYKIKADIKLVGTSVSNDVSGYINMNARYIRDGITGSDHVIKQTNFKAGEWKTVEHTLVMPSDVTPRENKDEFAFYSNPITIEGTQYGVSYCVDNVEIYLYALPEETAVE